MFAFSSGYYPQLVSPAGPGRGIPSASSIEQIYFSPPFGSSLEYDRQPNIIVTMSGHIDTHDRPFRQLGRGAMESNIDRRTSVLRPPVVISAPLRRRRPARFPTSTPLACRSFSLGIAQEPTYRWVAGRLLSLASSLIAQPTRYRPLHSDVRAYLAARVNKRVVATNCRVVDPYQNMEQP